MSSTYLNLFIKAKRECGIPGAVPTAVTSQTGPLLKLVEFIADADMSIQSKWLDWGFLHGEHSVSTVVGEKDIAVPSDFGMWDEDSFFLNYTSNSYTKLEKKDYFVWRNTDRLGTQTNAKPLHFIVKPNKAVILHPPPDAVYTLTADYYKTATRMTANTSTSLIPTKFDRLIISGAKKMWAEDEEAWELYKSSENEYNDLMVRLESLYLPDRQAYTMGNSGGIMVVPE